MNKKILQTALALATICSAMHKDMYDEDLHMQQPDSEPRPILR